MCGKCSELSSLFEKNVDRIESVTQDGIVDAVSTVLHSLGSSHHLHCMTANGEHQLEPTFFNMWWQEWQVIMYYHRQPLKERLWGMPCLSPFNLDNSEIWILYHFPEFPHRMKTLLISWLIQVLLDVLSSLCPFLLSSIHSLLLLIKCLYLNPWLASASVGIKTNAYVIKSLFFAFI